MNPGKKSLVLLLIAALVIVLALSGCGNGNSGENQSGESNEQSNQTNQADQTSPDSATEETAAEENVYTPPKFDQPIELSWYIKWPEESWKSYFADRLKAKFPNVTFKHVPNIEPEMIASGNVPDIIFMDNFTHIYGHVDQGVLEDLGPLVDLSGLDMSSFDQSTIETTKTGYKGQLYGLPWGRGTTPVLYINTEVFDKFNVPYPDKTKAMTWDETVELAKKLTGTIDGVQYRGIDLQNPGYILDAKSPPEIDENNQPLYQKDPLFRKFFEYLQAFWSIPGIWPEGADPTKVVHAGQDEFAKKKNVAMLVYWGVDWALEPAEKENGLKWDYRPFPVWPDALDVGPVGYVNLHGISANSKYKAEAFEILKYLMSDEFQMILAKEGAIPLSTKTEIEQAAIDALRTQKNGKSIEAMFALKPAIPHQYEEIPRYRAAAVGTWGIVEQFAKLDKDINTVLREMDEQSLQNIEKMKAEGK